MRPKVVAIVPSAGFGKRLGLKVKKPFVKLAGKPLITYALRSLSFSDAVDSIIIAAERGYTDQFWRIIKKYRISKVKDVVIGGKTRFESVRNCLKRVDPSFDIVMIHDGARPFIDSRTIRESVRCAEKYGACVVAVPERDTVKLAGRGLFVSKTLDRNMVYRAQTPQVFKASIIKRAYFKHMKMNATDDAGIVEIDGARIKILRGSYNNIKITTKEDLKLAEVLL